MTIDFFISYAREDAEYARALVKNLTDHKWTVWMDEKDIPPSVPWMAEIQRSINESMIVVAIESSDWLSSEACHIEVGLAEQGRVPIVRVRPDVDNIANHVSQVVRMYRALPAWRLTSLDAAAAAAIWDSSGRKSSLLSRGKALNQMRRDLRAHSIDFAPPAAAFIRAASRAADRRLITGLVLGLVVPIMVLATLVSVLVGYSANQQASKNIAESTAVAQRSAYHDWNTYAGLERASDSVVKNFALYRELFIDLTDRTPSAWDPTPATTSGPLSERSPDGLSTATAEGSGVVVTDASGQARRLLASARITAIAWSPDSRWVAAATQNGADVISVLNAQVIPLRGGSGRVTSIRWIDAQRVSVGGTNGTGTWQVLDGKTVARVGTIRYGTAAGNTTYTVDADGVVSAIRTGAAAASTIRLWAGAPVGVTPTGIDSADGTIAVAFIAPDPFVELIDIKTGAARQVQTPSCPAIGLSLASDAKTMYLACNNPSTNETRVDLASGSISSRPFQTQLAYGVRVQKDRVLWGGLYGGVYQSSLTLSPSGLLTPKAGCGAPIRNFAGSPGGSAVFPIGDATGTFGCAARIQLTGPFRVDHLIFNATDSNTAPAAALNSSGSLVAYGLADGQVRVFTTSDFDPVYFAQVLPDQVRSISFTKDGKSILVGGAGGELVTVRLPFTSHAEGARVLESEGRARLENAIHWGIYKSTMEASETKQ